jgi:hypothetical protein
MNPVERVRFVHGAADVPTPIAGTLVIVLDVAWTPAPDARPDVISARQAFGAVVAGTDLPDTALAALDGFALDAHLADRLLVDGVTYWFRARETAWRWLHERLGWYLLLDSLKLARPGVAWSHPADVPAIGDVARAIGGSVTTESDRREPSSVADGRGATPSGPSAPHLPRVGSAASAARFASLDPRRWLRGAGGGRHAGGSPGTGDGAARERILADRIARMRAGDRPRVLVLTTPATYQRTADGARRDPILGSSIMRLGEAGLDVVLLGLGLDARQDDDWQRIDEDERLLPQSMLRSRWARPEDPVASEVAVTEIRVALAKPAEAALTIGPGVDVTEPFHAMLATELGRIVETDVLQHARIVRLLAELEPRAILLAQEGIRLAWLRAARSAGIPVHAVQHGVLYAGHAGYPNRRHDRLVLPTTTFVSGDYERRLLVDELAYLADEVVVAGSPRLDLDVRGAPRPDGPPGGAPSGDGARAAVRAALGVADRDRLLVISTIHLPFIQVAHVGPMIERLLGGPLPGVHLAFKQHPGERDEGPYRGLIDGLARARRDPPPPISIIRDIDLYALLRAADAHLGLHSTVLTDAVAAGCPNLIDVGDAHRDLIGYVAAGVARPVANEADIRDALDHPDPAEPADVSAFLMDHVLPGDAGLRIATVIADRVGRTRDTDPIVATGAQR